MQIRVNARFPYFFIFFLITVILDCNSLSSESHRVIRCIFHWITRSILNFVGMKECHFSNALVLILCLQEIFYLNNMKSASRWFSIRKFNATRYFTKYIAYPLFLHKYFYILNAYLTSFRF